MTWLTLLEDGAPPLLLHREVLNRKLEMPECLQRLYKIIMDDD